MRRIVLSVISVLSALAVVSAADPVEVRLWPDGAPSSNHIPAGKEDKSNLNWVTYVSDATMTVFPADKPNGTALLMCPGGAYFGLAMAHEGFDMARYLNDAGVTLAVLKYRLPNGGYHEVPVDDARQALRILRQRAAEWGIDPGRIGIGGASAGGHLAATVATHVADSASAVSFQVLAYPVITMVDSVTNMASRDNLLGKNPQPELIDYYSCEKHVTPATAPAFIAVSADDDIVPVSNSVRYFEALQKNGVPVSLHIYPDGKHGWACRDRFRYRKQCVDELLFWLDNLNK